MHFFGFHELVYVQVSQVVISNLIFTYDGKDFVPLVPSLNFTDLRDVTENKKCPINWSLMVVEVDDFIRFFTSSYKVVQFIHIIK